MSKNLHNFKDKFDVTPAANYSLSFGSLIILLVLIIGSVVYHTKVKATEVANTVSLITPKVIEVYIEQPNQVSSKGSITEVAYYNYANSQNVFHCNSKTGVITVNDKELNSIRCRNTTK